MTGDTTMVEVHRHIGREGIIVELRSENHNHPFEDDMSHLTSEQAHKLRNKLNEYLCDSNNREQRNEP